ncbi:DUF934 domain-containing protein [Asticcacaulis sp. YBE204]|uniref:DUF934 domain-containing protein n=1 Tax=Asticcacaulis sp. YBE204 TaxID=1282363 RepID=UPI0003C3B3AC|nr:DUF934 domain-containing protein [Asticcacaulis sp. YBE204]ESQ81156.1 hypothetical protein AEYBE204_02140 [Asticcacaulis sp. YBE204]
MSPLNSAHEPKLVAADGTLIPDGWRLLADEDTVGVDEPNVLGFDRALNELDGLNGKYGVRVNPADDVRKLLPFIEKIALIEVAFPGYRDGRGYSTARILREEGFTGPIRAVGDVLRDQLLYMIRVGFDEFLVKDADPQGAIAHAKSLFDYAYQSAADDLKPVWQLRQEAGL